MHEEGEGVPINHTEAARYFKIGEDHNYTHLVFNNGRMLDKGYYVRRNQQETSRYYKIAVDQGHPEAMNSYVISISDRLLNEAAHYFKLPAEKGLPD